MRKRTLLVLALSWIALSAVLWKALQPVAADWVAPWLSGFDPHSASVIIAAAAIAFPLAAAATALICILLFARPTRRPRPGFPIGGTPSTRATTKTIRINPDPTLVNAGLRFGLQAIADGKNAERFEEIYFKKLNDRGALMAQVPYDDRRGLQFQCFVDYKGTKLERVKHALSASDYRPVTARADKFRIWFLLPNFKIAKSSGGQTRNVVGPI
jgi:hypothetical protein